MHFQLKIEHHHQVMHTSPLSVLPDMVSHVVVQDVTMGIHDTQQNAEPGLMRYMESVVLLRQRRRQFHQLPQVNRLQEAEVLGPEWRTTSFQNARLEVAVTSNVMILEMNFQLLSRANYLDQKCCQGLKPWRLSERRWTVWLAWAHGNGTQWKRNRQSRRRH